MPGDHIDTRADLYAIDYTDAHAASVGHLDLLTNVDSIAFQYTDQETANGYLDSFPNEDGDAFQHSYQAANCYLDPQLHSHTSHG